MNPAMFDFDLGRNTVVSSDGMGGCLVPSSALVYASATPLGESVCARQLPRTTSAGLQIGASKFQRAVSKPNFATTRVTKSN